MASALQPEIWRPNMPGVRELITYSSSYSRHWNGFSQIWVIKDEPSELSNTYNILLLIQADYCCLNDQWPLQDIIAVFSRHYLHQNRAIEVFFSDRSSAFFAFESNGEVKTAVRRLPKVGIGTAYDFAQTRSVTLLAEIVQLYHFRSVLNYVLWKDSTLIIVS